MLALAIPDAKNFMAKLLKENAFDTFEARSILINSFAHFEFSGTEELEGETAKMVFCRWERFRPLVLSIIKGEKTPKTMKMVFALPAEFAAERFPEAAALFMNILYDEGRIIITTGASPKKFTLDKSLDSEWDDYVKKILNKRGIAFSEQM